MSYELLISLLQSKIDIGTFNRWISGDNVKEIDSRLSRSRFALHVLNYIQQSSSILFSSSREILTDFKSNESKRTSSFVTHSNVHSKLSVEPVFSSNTAIRTPKDACSSENKSAFNSSFFSPDLRTSPITQIPFNLDSSNESPIKTNNQANHQSPKNLHGSSLHKYSIQHRDYNKSKFPIYNSTPKDNDKTSESLTEKNVKSRLFFESSDSSSEFHSVSSNLQAYDQNFPSLTNSRPKVINVKSKNAPNLTKDSSSSNSSLKSFNSSISSTNVNQSCSPIYCNSPKLQARINQRKRVNPTLVQKIPLRDFIKHEDTKTKKDTNFTQYDETTPQKSSPFQQSVLEEPRNNYNEERLILKEKRYGPKSNQQTIFPNITVKSLITPEPIKVTYFNYIVCLANIYNSLLDYNFVPNLSAEIHFIFSLLTLKISENCVMKEQFVMGSNLCESEKLEQSTGEVPKNFLNNIHNCVMFAVCIITSQINLWRYLDRTTLKLLANNERLILFSSSFATDLNLLYQNKDVPIKYESRECTISTIIFEIKTDNRDNFTDLNSFSKFRKQRDMFYELWREKNIELTPNKVLCILSLSREPVNMAHLARLVCCQLISDILNKKNQDPEVIEDGLSLGITKDKLSLLEARLKQPQRKEQGIPRPLQQFPDKQKFYKDFFEITCENVFFREHVINYLITKILELDSRNFEMDDPDNKEEATKEFEQTVLSLCVLAKFLGLIVFLPFRIPISSEFSNFIFDDQLAVRRKVQPLIDLNMNLQNAIKQRTLVKTVPWIIEYLGMMDLVSLHLPCHRSLLNTLIKIYQSLCPCLNTEINSNILNKADIKLILNEENNKICKPSLLFLRLVLGWLFDFSFFPEPLFSCLRESPDNLGFKLYSGDLEEIKCSLDTAEVVSESLIFQLCPYFTHLKYLLISNEKDGSVRHITPVTAHRKLQLISEVASEQELKLEDSFLKGQVASFQNTIEFVKDRVASACIKYICSIIILKRKQEALAKFESFYKTDAINKDAISEYAENLKMEIDSTIAGYCEPRIHKSFEALLGPELVDQNLINIALKIATRKCKEKIVDWLSSHINPKDIFTKVAEQISNSSKDIRKQIQNPDNKTEGKSLTFGSPISRIINLKALIFQIIELQVKNLDTSTVINTLKDLQIKDTLYHPLLTSMSVDFLLMLVTYQPLLVTESVLKEFSSLWTSINVLWKSSCNPFRRLICSRNIMLFCQHYDRKASWDALSRFIVFILSKRFLTIEEFEDQCVIVFRQVWPRTVLKHISSCLKSTLEKVKQENICLNNSKTMLMIELVSETSQDLDDDQR